MGVAIRRPRGRKYRKTLITPGSSVEAVSRRLTSACTPHRFGTGRMTTGAGGAERHLADGRSDQVRNRWPSVPCVQRAGIGIAIMRWHNTQRCSHDSLNAMQASALAGRGFAAIRFRIVTGCGFLVCSDRFVRGGCHRLPIMPMTGRCSRRGFLRGGNLHIGGCSHRLGHAYRHRRRRHAVEGERQAKQHAQQDGRG